MSIVVFEDSSCDALAPISTGRLAATILCGGWRLIDLVGSLGTPAFAISRPYLRDILAADCDKLRLDCGGGESSARPPRLMLSARAIPSQANAAAIRRLLDAAAGGPKVIYDRDTVAAVVDPPWTVGQLLGGGYEDMPGRLQEAREFEAAEPQLQTFELPHEVVAANMRIIGDNLEHLIAAGPYTQRQDGLFVAGQCKVGEYCLFDTKAGPIVLEENVSIGPYTMLRGPIHIGANSKVLEHSSIKDYVSAGHTTKLGGEVEASVVEPYTNKQHHGFLGHSYLGSWINLGAGTCNSDLKNTYGLVNMEYPVGKAATGMQFLGCIMGDYSKTAINTGIFTGKVVGVCSMMYGFVTSNVPSFVNYARLFGQVAAIPPEVMIATQGRVFARRNVAQRPIDVQLIHDMYALTRGERAAYGEGVM